MTAEIIDLILYGDIHEAPLNILGDKYSDFVIYDEEQFTRLSIAATLLARWEKQNEKRSI